MLVPSLAHAELTLSVAAEYFEWKESITPEVKETGPLYALGIAYTQERDAGPLFAYRGKLWGGRVDYEGSTLFSGAPVSDSTDYLGASNELQLRWRNPGKVGSNVDGVFGAGLDTWRRSLSTVQKEDYAIGYLRLGVESASSYGGDWSVSLGLKYPFWTYENAHLDEIGFDSNPILHPGKDISPYGSIGYRFTEKLQVVAYYESFRFTKSDDVRANEVALGHGQTTIFQPASSMAIYGLKLEYRLR